ncbi:hypothetical protein CHS0354_028292 [Potamilus streckersoni]|uniref:C2 domain-containing protein n=1 Tax=Potamilus streckersoni TaxID=2493646 RepID=A0AAE0VIW2_9BIVA|nr:hypothetical protein CHS0354_028292 [Potamilus streckersoni]
MTVPVVAIAVGGLFGLIAVGTIVFLLWKLCTRRRKQSSSYEKIVGDHKRHSRIESIALFETNNSLKPIPFTVPQHVTPSIGRREGSEDQLCGGLSEPSTAGGKRPSVEVPGAYALGTIDPSLYRISDEDDNYEIPQDHIGRIWFAVEYERESEKLLVTVIKTKNLPCRPFGGPNGCDPFVRIYLMPDERRYLQSKFKKKTCNPKFEESYIFQVSNRNINDRILKFSVFDVDRHKKHNVIGHALYPLRDHDCDSNERLVVWRDLEREVLETTGKQKGELTVSLTYNNHLERITVGIFEGRAFVAEGSTSIDTAQEVAASPSVPSIDSYVKVQLVIQNKTIKSKKTEVVKKTDDPAFNESFTFKLPIASLDTANITVTAMQHQSGYKDKVIGRVTIGSFMFARGKELQHWNEMVSNQREQITYWHTLA